MDSGDEDHIACAHNFLGHFYRGGFGTPVDMPRALRHFEAAARLGNGEAAFNAGLYLDKGAPGIVRDPQRAEVNYQIDAANGYAHATTSLALLIMTGDATGRNTNEAADLLRNASDLGDDHASELIEVIESDTCGWMAHERGKPGYQRGAKARKTPRKGSRFS